MKNSKEIIEKIATDCGMTMKEELTKMLMESYDRCVADASKAAIAAIEQAYAAGAESMRKACAKVCKDIDEIASKAGWKHGTPEDCFTAIQAISITPESASPQFSDVQWSEEERKEIAARKIAPLLFNKITLAKIDDEAI